MPATATDASSVSSTRSFLIFPPFWHVPDSRLTTNRWLAYPTPIASNRNVDRSVQAKRARPRRACGRATWPLAHQNLAEPTRVRLATCRGTGALELAALFAPVQSFEGDAPWSSVSRERERDISPVLRGSATRETPLKDWGVFRCWRGIARMRRGRCGRHRLPPAHHSCLRDDGATARARPFGSLLQHERRLHASIVERFREAVERDTEADELRQHVGPALAGAIEGAHGREPVDSVRVDAAEHDAVTKNGVDADDAAVELHPLNPRVDPDQAGDAAAAQHPEGPCHHLGVSRRLDYEVEAADVLHERSERLHRRGHIAGAGGGHEVGAPVVGGVECRRPHLQSGEPEQVRRKHPDRARADHERALELPRLASADRAGLADRPLADRRRLHEHAEPAEYARDADQLGWILGKELACEPVQARDPALAVVAGQAGIGGAVATRETVPARPAHDRRD